MNISHILTLSSAHITPQTAEILNDPDDDRLDWTAFVAVYPKGNVGWWIYVDDANPAACPPDLAACIRLAQLNHCDWLCLDNDCDITPGLTVYEW